MRIAGKVWGTTSPIFETSTFELHNLSVTGGHRCSKHLHETKFNGFYVIDGLVEVTVWQPTGTVDITGLMAGDHMVVPPGVEHQFKAIEDSRMLEAYWTELSKTDIVRRDVGE